MSVGLWSFENFIFFYLYTNGPGPEQNENVGRTFRRGGPVNRNLCRTLPNIRRTKHEHSCVNRHVCHVCAFAHENKQ